MVPTAPSFRRGNNSPAKAKSGACCACAPTQMAPQAKATVGWTKLRCRRIGTAEGSLSFREAMGKGWCMAADHQRAWVATACTKCVCASPFWTQRRALLHSTQRRSKALCLEDLKLFVVLSTSFIAINSVMRPIWRRETLPFRVGIADITYHIAI